MLLSVNQKVGIICELWISYAESKQSYLKLHPHYEFYADCDENTTKGDFVFELIIILWHGIWEISVKSQQFVEPFVHIQFPEKFKLFAKTALRVIIETETIVLHEVLP